MSGNYFISPTANVDWVILCNSHSHRGFSPVKIGPSSVRNRLNGFLLTQ